MLRCAPAISDPLRTPVLIKLRAPWLLSSYVRSFRCASTLKSRPQSDLTTQMRLELTTSAVTGRRSNQLSHWAFSRVCTLKTTLNTKILTPTPPVLRTLTACWPTPRPISTGQLHTLPCFHPRPINLVVFKGSYSHIGMGYLILRGASRLDAFSVYPVPTWLLCHALGSTTDAPAVGPPRSSRTKGSSSQISCAHAG